MNPGEAVKMDSEYRSFLAELGGGPAPEGGAGGAAPPPRGARCSAGGCGCAVLQQARCQLLHLPLPLLILTCSPIHPTATSL